MNIMTKRHVKKTDTNKDVSKAIIEIGTHESETEVEIS